MPITNTVRTIYGNAVQTASLLGLPYTPIANSTLNERFSIEASAVLQQGQMPTLKYMCIGNGGSSSFIGSDGSPLDIVLPHDSTDAACFKHLPFILRETTNPLTPTEEAKYALKKQVTYNSVTYNAYYLKRLNLSNVSISLQKRNINNGIITSTPFIPDNSNLNPVPVDINNNGSNVVASDFVVATALLSVELTQQECNEIVNAATIIYGREEYGFISEIGICTGVDKVLPNSFNEAICVQVATFIATKQYLFYNRNSFIQDLDIGVNEPTFIV